MSPGRTTAAALALAALLPASHATPLLRCEVTYAGSTQVVEARVVDDPYPVPSVDVSGRFRFKAVMVGQGERVDHIALYAYLDTHRQPILVQEAKYLPPFRTGAAPYPLTGEQHLYAGPVERELLYQCTLEGVAP